MGRGGPWRPGAEGRGVSAQCFAVRSLGWVEIPEEDLAPGKSSIAVNNCIQQLSNSKGQASADNRGEVRAGGGAAGAGSHPRGHCCCGWLGASGQRRWQSRTLSTQAVPCGGPGWGPGGSGRAVRGGRCLGGLSPRRGLSGGTRMCLRVGWRPGTPGPPARLRELPTLRRARTW